MNNTIDNIFSYFILSLFHRYAFRFLQFVSLLKELGVKFMKVVVYLYLYSLDVMVTKGGKFFKSNNISEAEFNK